MEALTPASTNATLVDLNTLSGTSSLPILGLMQAIHSDPRALYSSFSMILVSEVGDKTFLIAAILAMRQSKVVVFSGAFLSLAVMSVLSALLGVMFPTLLPRGLTNLLAAGLFAVFGVRMLIDAMKMDGTEIQEEWQEAEREIQQEDSHDLELDNLESASPSLHSHKDPPSSMAKSLSEGTKNLCGLCFSPVFAQAFVLTFLGEWGDRSQIATIALAAAHNVVLVCIGTVAGHAVCTSIAVIGGSVLATKISVKKVTLGGAGLFLVFAVIYAVEAWVGETGGQVVGDGIKQVVKGQAASVPVAAAVGLDA